jgi:hypothetical protein
MAHEPVLGPKHFKALELIEEGILKYKEIAVACGWEPDYLYALIEGNERTAGSIVHLFQAELNRIQTRWGKQEKQLNKDNRQRTQLLLNDRLKALQKGKVTEKKSYEISRIMQVLAKSTPNVEMNFSYYKGLTKEELENEFSKLSAIAQRTLNLGRIQSAGEKRSGEVPGTPGTRDNISEK